MLPDLNLNYLHASKLLLPSASTINLTLVGCGGTGSWLAQGVVRVARLLIEKFQREVTVTFVDPDVIEEKNIYRQNFCQAEIGQNKAMSLAWRFSAAWGIQIMAMPHPFKAGVLRNGDLAVIIGCVDNAAARQEIRNDVQHNTRTWWLDCGNHQAAGQVVVGCGSRVKNPFQLPGFCSWLPLPSERHPDLLEAKIEETRLDISRMSCADLAMLDSQGLAINQRIAAEATDYLVRMLLTKDLQKWGTYIDLASGVTRSKYIVEEGCLPGIVA
jgi:PRTRC genetic system ThiF family protein